MATIIAPFTAVDGNGNVRANAKLYFYETGTSTPQNTFSDSALSVTNANPVVADSNGLFSAIYLGDPPTFMAYKAVLKTSADVTVWTTDPLAGAPITTPISASLLRGYGSGDVRTANTTTTITLGAGVWADDTNTSMMSVAAGAIDCATVGADGLDTGALGNDTWYHRFIIGKTDGTIARLASTSVSSPTLPAGYTLKRRTGSFRTNGSAQIINHSQFADEFMWSATVSGPASTVAAAVSAQVLSAGVPTGIKVMAKIRAAATGGTAAGVVLYSPEQAAQTVNSPTGNYSLRFSTSGETAGEFSILTDTSATINAISVSAGANLAIGIYGWVDWRGRDD